MLDYGMILCGILLIIYYFGNAVISGFLSFSLVFLCIGIIFVTYGCIELKTKQNLFMLLPKALRISITICISIIFIFFVLVESTMIYIGQRQESDKTDLIIVLGAGLMGDEISSSLRYRLDAALEYHVIHPDVPILVTGGQGYGETRTEASAMQEYLISHGVPKENIYLEETSTNTYENFLFAKEVLEDKKITVQNVTVITNNFHMMRAMYLGELQGFHVSPYSADTYVPQILNDYVREFFACIKTIILYH